MMIKAVTLLIVTLAVLGMFGKFRTRKTTPKRSRTHTARKCQSCGGYLVGTTPCGCGARN